MSNEENIDIQTFQIHAADESTAATPRLEPKAEDASFSGLRKSSSFQELTEKKVSNKTKSRSRDKLKKAQDLKNNTTLTNNILVGITYGVGAAFVVVIIDAIMLVLK